MNQKEKYSYISGATKIFEKRGVVGLIELYGFSDSLDFLASMTACQDLHVSGETYGELAKQLLVLINDYMTMAYVEASRPEDGPNYF